MTATASISTSRTRTIWPAALIFLGALAFSALFSWLNYLQYNWLSPFFERSGTPTSWGIMQRLFLIIPLAAISIWKPRQMGFQLGTIRAHWRMLLIMMVINVGVVSGYLLLTGATPYSGLNMLFNEVITVPLVEEVMWRGLVFAVLLALLRRFLHEQTSVTLAVIFSGVCFGLLHANNALFGYPLAFVAIQVLSAVAWGIMYGFARAKTGSIYPSILLHAAMNLAAALA